MSIRKPLVAAALLALVVSVAGPAGAREFGDGPIGCYAPETEQGHHAIAWTGDEFHRRLVRYRWDVSMCETGFFRDIFTIGPENDQIVRSAVIAAGSEFDWQRDQLKQVGMWRMHFRGNLTGNICSEPSCFPSAPATELSQVCDPRYTFPDHVDMLLVPRRSTTEGIRVGGVRVIFDPCVD